jgi:urease accessory protein
MMGAALMLGLAAAPAEAHSGTGLAGGFVSGFAHPFGGADHLLAMASVGLWGAFLGRPLVYLLPVVFPLMMVVGAVFGMTGVPMASVETGIALSVLVLGSCIALAFRAPLWLAMAIVALFAIFHGCAHGRELPSAADPAGYSLGFVLATGSIHIAGITLGLVKARAGGEAAIRIAGGAIGLTGLAFLVGLA